VTAALRWYLAVACLTWALPGCGSDQLASTGAADGGGDARPGDAPASGPECPGPGYATATDSILIGAVSASVTDLDGAPLPGVLAQVCGIDLCIDLDVSVSGSVARAIDESFLKPAFKYGDGVSYAQFAQLMLPNAVGAVTLGTVTTIAFPELAGSSPLRPGTTAASGGVTLELGDDFRATIDPFDFETPEEQGFRAVELPIDAAPPAVHPGLGLELVYAMTPTSATLCPAAVVNVPNTPNWPAGTAAEIYVHGLSIDEPWAPYGGWAKVSDAEVSADGATITTRGHAGLPTLSVMGIRRAL
jgi:hypothetical protein